MREVITHTRRQRVTNYGDAQAVQGAGRATLFTMHKEHADPLLLTVVCEELVIPPAAIGTGDFRPMVHIDWGHGASSVQTDVEVTFRQRFPVVASTMDVQGFIGAFALPGQPPPSVPPDATARFRAFVGEGLDGLRPFATRHVTQLGTSAGLL